MAKAWLERESERQQFLESLQQAFCNELEETHQYEAGQLLLCVAFGEFFAQHQRIQQNLRVSLAVPDNPIKDFLFENVWPAVQEFARTREEALSLMASLFEWSSESVVRAAKIPLQTQELLEPHAVFDGHGAMDEV